MPDQEKPYRLYRGGRVKGRVPLERRLGQPEKGAPHGAPTPERRRRRWLPRRFRWKLALALALPTALLLAVLWGVGSYLALSHGVGSANDRVPPSVRRLLTKQDGLLSSTPTTILVLGTDGGETGRPGSRHSDSIMLIRTDPGKHRMSYLSIPRIFASTSPATARTRSTPRSSSAAPRSRCRR